MGQVCIFTILCLALILLLHDASAGKKGTSNKKPTSTKTSTSSSSNKSHQGSKTQAKSPNQNTAGGIYPSRHQYPGGGGGYPVRSEGQPGVYPVGTGRSYPNWNPKNKILSPRYGSAFGGPRYGNRGSPFSRSVQDMGHKPSMKSKGFAKKAVVVAGVGAMTGMAIGYGLGRYPQPHFHFKSHQEERYYNHYMHHRYGIKSTDINDYGRDYIFQPPPEAQTYEKYMDKCMNRTDLLQNHDAKISSIQGGDPMNGSLAISNGTSERVGIAENGTSEGVGIAENGTSETVGIAENGTSEGVGIAENGTSEVPVPVESQESDDDTVSITETEFPVLIQQMKVQKCVKLYMAYSEGFLQKQTQEHPSNHGDPNGHSGLLILLSTTIMALHITLML